MTIIVFLDKHKVPNNLSEIHVFDNDNDALVFSSSLLSPFRRHLVKRIPDECCHFDGKNKES